MIQPTGYWTFFCNTKQWDIELDLAAIASKPHDIFSVTRWQKDWFRRGQLGVVRVGIDQRTKEQLKGRPRLKRGIYTLVEIMDEAMPVSGDMGAYWTGRYIVKIRYIRSLLHDPISLQYFQEDTPEYDKYLVHGFQASSMPLKPQAFEAVVAGAGGIETLDFELNRSAVREHEDILNLERLYQGAVPEIKEHVSHLVEMSWMAEEYKRQRGYRCQICEAMGTEPHSFQRSDGTYYIEVHHVMPMEQLMAADNLLTVCPRHHRQLHYGRSHVLENSYKRFLFLIEESVIEVKKG